MKGAKRQESGLNQQEKIPLIFIVHKDDTYRHLLIKYLSLAGFDRIKAFASADSCLNFLHLKPALIITEYDLDGPSGLVLLKKIQEHRPRPPVIVISGQDDISVATKAMKYGAFDYVIKNKHAFDNIVQSVEHLCALNQRLNRNRKQYLAASALAFLLVFLLIILISYYQR